MPIVGTDIKYFFSGGSSATDGTGSWGGNKSTTELTSGKLHDLFDLVNASEALAGDTEYRAIYIQNTHASLTLSSAVVWIVSSTTSADTTISIGEGTGGTSSAITSTANENTAPSGVSFTEPTTKATGVVLGNIAAGAWRGIWIRRTVAVSTVAYSSDTATIRIEGDTAA